MLNASESGLNHVGTLWHLDLSAKSLPGPRPRVEVRFQRFDSEAAALLAQAMELDSQEEVLRRLGAGKQCFAGIVDGKIATYGWVTFDKELIGELRLHIQLSQGEAYIWDCATVPEYRGLRLYPALLWYIIEDLWSQGFKRVWIGADNDNVPSQVGMRLCGFCPIADFVLDYALAFRAFWIRGHPGAPAELVEDARNALLGKRHKAWLAALSSVERNVTSS
jgi:ribosomal protein S18 acetylase RimI-like enzyme